MPSHQRPLSPWDQGTDTHRLQRSVSFHTSFLLSPTIEQQQLQSPRHSPPTTNTNSTTNTNQPVFAEADLHKNILKPEDVKFNYESTPADMFLQTLVRENDLTKAKEDIKLSKQQGQTIKEYIVNGLASPVKF